MRKVSRTMIVQESEPWPTPVMRISFGSTRIGKLGAIGIESGSEESVGSGTPALVGPLTSAVSSFVLPARTSARTTDRIPNPKGRLMPDLNPADNFGQTLPKSPVSSRGEPGSRLNSMIPPPETALHRPG